MAIQNIKPKINSFTGEILAREPVVNYWNNVPMRDDLCGGLYGKDSNGYYRLRFSGEFPISRLKTPTLENIQKVIKDMGDTTGSVTIVIDRMVTVGPANNSLATNCNIRIETGGPANARGGFTVTGGAIFTLGCPVILPPHQVFYQGEGGGTIRMPYNRDFDPKWFGARVSTTSNIYNSGAAFNWCAACAQASSSNMIIPAGMFYLEETFDPPANLNIIGGGWRNSSLIGNTEDIPVVSLSDSNTFTGVWVRGGGRSSIAVEIAGLTNRITLRNIRIDGAKTHGLYVDRLQNSLIEEVFSQDNATSGVGSNIYLTENSAGAENCTFFNVNGNFNSSTGPVDTRFNLWVGNSRNCRFIGGIFERGGIDYPVYIKNSSSLYFIGGEIQSSGKACIYVETGTTTFLSGSLAMPTIAQGGYVAETGQGGQVRLINVGITGTEGRGQLSRYNGNVYTDYDPNLRLLNENYRLGHLGYWTGSGTGASVTKVQPNKLGDYGGCQRVNTTVINTGAIRSVTPSDIIPIGQPVKIRFTIKNIGGNGLVNLYQSSQGGTETFIGQYSEGTYDILWKPTVANSQNAWVLRNPENVAKSWDIYEFYVDLTNGEPETLRQFGIKDAYTKDEIDSILNSYITIAEKGQPNGVASLGADGKVPFEQLPDSIVGQIRFGGTYDGAIINATANFPELNGQPLPAAADYSDVYFISTTTYTYNGETYNTGDWIISTGTEWTKIANSDAVTTVFGRSGNVTAQAGDYSTSLVTESPSNLYFTQERARASISVTGGLTYNPTTGVIGGQNLTGFVNSVFGRSGPTITAQSGDYNTNLVPEGSSNLYFTNTRARNAISVSGDLSYNATTGVLSYTAPSINVSSVFGRIGAITANTGDYNTSQVTESGNLYFTNARARGAISVSGDLTYNSTTGVLSYTAPPTPTIPVTSVFGRTGAIVASNGDYTTTQVTEGTNLYFTQARARTSISVSGDLSYNSSTGVISYTAPSSEIPTLQSVTDEGNLTSNSLKITGSDNAVLTGEGLMFLHSPSTSTISRISPNIANLGQLSMTDNYVILGFDGSSSTSIIINRVENNLDARFVMSGRTSGLAAINPNEYIIKSQLDAAISNIPVPQNPDLQTSTDVGNITNNALHITGFGKIDTSSVGLILGYDLDLEEATVGFFNGSGYKKNIIFTETETRISALDVNNSGVTLIIGSGTNAVANFSSRVQGLDAINDNEFITKKQLDEYVPPVPPSTINDVFKEVPTGAIDSSNTVFTLNYNPYNNSEHVFYNGILQLTGLHYTIVDNVITFIEAPVTGSNIVVTYKTQQQQVTQNLTNDSGENIEATLDGTNFEIIEVNG